MIRLIHKFCYSHTILEIAKTLQTSKKSINSVDKLKLHTTTISIGATTAEQLEGTSRVEQMPIDFLFLIHPFSDFSLPLKLRGLRQRY